MGPQEKYQFNTARPKAVNVLRLVFKFGLARDKLDLNSIAVAVQIQADGLQFANEGEGIILGPK